MAYTLYAAQDDWSASQRVRIVAQAVAGGDSGALLKVVTGAAAVSAAAKETSLPLLPLLRTPDGFISGTSPVLRYLSALRADTQLSGGDACTAAAVDGWLDAIFTEIDIPLHAASMSSIARVPRAELPATMAKMEAYMTPRTYWVAEYVTLVDVAAFTAVQHAVALGVVRDLAAFPALQRWCDTLRHHPWFAATTHATSTASSTTVAAPAAVEVASGAAALPTALTSVRTTLPGAKYSSGRARVADVLFRGEAGVGATVCVCGWARTVREANAGALVFIALSDGSGPEPLQVVVERGTAGFDDIATCGGKDASFRVQGRVAASTGKGQTIEVIATSVTVVGRVNDAAHYPIPKGKTTLEHLRSILHLRPRTNTIGAIARIRNACAFATHTFFQERGFMYVHTPIITGSDCEGAGEMFGVTTMLPANGKASSVPAAKDGTLDYSKDFFGKPTFLTVSGQLQVEAYACALSDVYTFGPTFRAENSHTARHLAEFWMIEPEISFATLAEDMALAEDYLKYCTRYVLDHCSKDIDFFESMYEKGLRARLENVVNEPFQVLTYTEAIELLAQPEHMRAGAFGVKPEWGIDLGSEHERYLTERVYKKPVILINYPKDIKAFYMKLNPDGRTVAAMDVLVPKVGEIMGGSQREDDYDLLHKRMTEMGVGVDNLAWYMDLRKYGSVPHAGFGLGFERLVMYVTGLENIRDAIPFPRFPGSAAL